MMNIAEKVVVGKETVIVHNVELKDLLNDTYSYLGLNLLVNGKELKIQFNEFAENPLEWDYNPNFLSLLRRSSIGTKKIYSKDGEEFTVPNDFDGPEKIESFLEKNGYFFKKVYGYSHGGLSLALEGYCPANFSCPFDSGVAGYLLKTKSEIREWYGVKRISSKIEERIIKNWLPIIEYTNYWLNGEVYLVEIDGDTYDIYGSSNLEELLEDSLTNKE